MKTISDVVAYYASQSYDSVEIDDDESWTDADLRLLRNVVNRIIEDRTAIAGDRPSYG